MHIKSAPPYVTDKEVVLLKYAFKQRATKVNRLVLFFNYFYVYLGK